MKTLFPRLFVTIILLFCASESSTTASCRSVQQWGPWCVFACQESLCNGQVEQCEFASTYNKGYLGNPNIDCCYTPDNCCAVYFPDLSSWLGAASQGSTNSFNQVSSVVCNYGPCYGVVHGNNCLHCVVICSVNESDSTVMIMDPAQGFAFSSNFYYFLEILTV
jgi:hypothetical protein